MLTAAWYGVTDFHTYTLEWTQDWMRLYVDSRLQAMIDLSLQSTKDSFFNRGNYPLVTESQGLEIPVTNIYNNSLNAPFDQDFYLIISLAAGGTSGWFPDNVGGKPWTDGNPDASFLFAQAQVRFICYIAVIQPALMYLCY